MTMCGGNLLNQP